MIRDGDETLRGVMALPGGVSPEPPLAAPGARPTTRVLDDGDDEVRKNEFKILPSVNFQWKQSIAGELGTVRGAPNIPPSATKLGWLDGSGPIASPARVKPKRILYAANPPLDVWLPRLTVSDLIHSQGERGPDEPTLEGSSVGYVTERTGRVGSCL